MKDNKIRSIFWTLLTFLFIFFDLHAYEVSYLARSTRALLMGDAFTPLADDAFTLFYNPAALGHNTGVRLDLMNPEIGVTNVLEEMDRFEDFPSNDASAMADRILGLPLHLHAGVHPGFRMGPVGFSLFLSTTANIVLHNAIHPIIDVNYKIDRGFIIGYAYNFGSNKVNKRRSGHNTAIGVAIKHFNRKGIFRKFSMFGTEILQKVSDEANSDYQKLLRDLGMSKGDAWGGDIGIEHKWFSKWSEMTFAASVLDIADTRFEIEDGAYAIPNQEMIVNAGVAWRQDFWVFDYSIVLDFHPVFSHIDDARKIHFGVEMGIPSIRLMAGLNEGYLCYGASLKFWPLTVYAGFYSVELGNSFKEQEGKRGIIYLSLFDFTFDVEKLAFKGD